MYVESYLLIITDHLPVFVSYPEKSNNGSDEKIKISFRNHNEKYASLFYNKIHEFDWHSLFSNDVSMFTNNIYQSKTTYQRLPIIYIVILSLFALNLFRKTDSLNLV